ncbi:MAG: UbiA prenyltransferase family protein [Bacteroidales bacterium]|nr:UbiA prenyltransferase family protein [Bacteroidales bacterium]
MLKHYVRIARPDHWFKNIFMLPGIVMGLYYTDFSLDNTSVLILAAGILATCLIASANYVINEFLDLEFDRFHPVKKYRTAVLADLNAGIVYTEYTVLALSGLVISFYISNEFFITELLFLFMGFLYNVKPFRTKDKAYLDVLTESINNPIRFILGWLLIGIDFIPPSSILVAYWMGGAFLMATKRFAEYRFIGDPDLAGKYRQSFKRYTENLLLVSTVFYALCSSFFLAIFLIKHRIELLISFPFIALLFTWYLDIGFEKDSIVQNPEKLYKKKGFVTFVVFLFILLVLLLKIDIPSLNWFIKNY